MFLAGNRARNGVTIVVAFKNLFTLGTSVKYFRPNNVIFHTVSIPDL